MVRAAALAVCLLALAAGAVAQTCTQGHLKLELVAPSGTSDPIAKCLTSFRLDIDPSCAITLTALQSHGSHVDGLFTSDASLAVGDKFVECPSARPAVPINLGTGTKLEAVRRAVIKALAGYVYGLDGDLEYNNELPVPDLDFFVGKLVVKRNNQIGQGLLNIVYAITEADVDEADMLCDDDFTPLGEVLSCANLTTPVASSIYNAADVCLSNEDADKPCPANTYQVMVVTDPHFQAWDEKETSFKVCGYCPAGTFGLGDGSGCTTCPAGQKSNVGGSCEDCPAGTYSNAGSSICIPCPTGTYSAADGTQECKECPEDTYAWIPGSTACLRCIQGVPEKCDADGVCPSGDASDAANAGKSLSTISATHIVDVARMTAKDGVCNLNAANPDYEIKAFTKCKGWASSMQLAFQVYGDCSIQISPISDPSCSDPTNNVTHEYGAIQQRAYYTMDVNGDFQIRSLFDTTTGVKNTVLLAIDADLKAQWYVATTDANEAYDNALLRDLPGAAQPEVCSAQLTVVGGTVLGQGETTLVPANGWECPPGSYFHGIEICPMCPVGFTCPGGDKNAADKIPCPPNTYNGMLGSSAPCTACPTPLGSGTYTSYAAAEQCDVERVDLVCAGGIYAGESWAYDLGSQQCQKCLAGTYRDLSGDECVPCAPGSSSKEGDATCTLCPPGQYSPSFGLADQTELLGTQCISCAEGSMPVADGTVEAAIGTPVAIGATACSACPAGSILIAADETCSLCGEFTYRTGDATPENNKCKPVPAGYFLKDAHVTIELCPVGTVSFYTGAPALLDRIPAVEDQCIACGELDATLAPAAPKWAHTFASRKGMTQCVPCPGGTVPLTVASTANGAAPKITASCVACPNAQYREPYTISATCTACGAGYEVGPSTKMDCTMCRPGTYMTAARRSGSGPTTNTCDLCPIHQFRSTFGATSCIKCPRGTQTANTGNVECTACPIGYNNNQQGEACKAAPAGTFVNTTGAFVTTPCPRGSWNDELAQDNCNPCAPGRYNNALGSKECKTCPAGTYSAGQATQCLDCRAGFAAPAGASACSPCKPGTFAPAVKAATCSLCPKGFQCPTNAMNKEGACPRGTFSNKEGNRLCTPCPVNTVSLGGRQGTSTVAVMACTKCAPGTNTRGLVGQNKCQVIRPQVKRLMF